MNMKKEIQKYINAIHNKDKKEYAMLYYKFLISGINEPDNVNLSYMGKQAVRMNLNKLMNN